MGDGQIPRQRDPKEAELVRETRLALLVTARAQELAGSSGGVLDDNVPLEQAISVVLKHGGKHAWLDSAEPVQTVEVPKERPFPPPGF
jgi:hypothetical protein